MRTAIALIAGFGLAIGTAMSASAGDETTAPGAVSAAGSAQLQGEVTDKEGDILTIRRSDGEQAQVRTTETTKIRGQEGELHLSDIDTGDQVRVTAMDSAKAGDEAGTHVAREIQVVEAGAGDSGIRDPRQMTPQQNPIQGIPDNTVTP